jgi:hypothetical protein
MALNITRIGYNDFNGAYQIIGAIQTNDVVNGHPVYIVLGRDHEKGEYVTWEQSWVYTEESDSVTNWAKSYFIGNYKSSTENGHTARSRAIADMADRLGVKVTFTSDITEIIDMWPFCDIEGILIDTLDFSTRKEILTQLGASLKIVAIKTYREWISNHRPLSTENGLVRAKSAIEAIAAVFYPEMYGTDGKGHFTQTS